MSLLGRVTDLYVYPVKSLGGVRLDVATVGDLGIDRDRRWMLVGDDDVFFTQREHARMALARATPADDGCIRVTAPNEDPITVVPAAPETPRRRVRVWDDVVDAQGYPADVDAWFSRAIGVACHLVYMPDDTRRRVDPTYAEPDDRTSFSDGYPLLLASRESLADLNARLVERAVAPVTIERFRPNVVVENTAGAFAEDTWRDVEIGETALRAVKPCGRCVITTIDPATATPSPRGEPLRTLATYRTRGGKTLFAQNLLVRRAGTIRVGDDVRAG